MELDEESSNKDFLIKRIIINLESERILPAIYAALAYVKTTEDDADDKELEALITGPELYRKIGFLDIIKSLPETATEYYDEDKDSDPYAYDEETEAIIRDIKKTLLSFVAKAIKDQESDVLEKLMETLNK